MNLQKELVSVHMLLANTADTCSLMMRQGEVTSRQLDCATEDTERAVIHLRSLAESIRPRSVEAARKPTAPKIPDFAAQLEVSEFGWLHITLNSLLPSCKYKTPAYLQSTLAGLLTGYQRNGRKLPYFEHAMLIIEEHCSIQNRQVYDQDNKGWKAIPNSIKGLIVPDDDQFTLEVALLSKQSEEVCCHIWVLPADEAGEYFSVRSGNFGFTF